MSSLSALNIVFAGTPDFSASVLEALLNAGHNVVAAYCQPDRRVGRGKKLAYGPVKTLALEHNIPVEQPTRFNAELDDDGLTSAEKLASYQPDLMIVVAYGLILPQVVLDAPKFGCVNIHASILPRWRGAAPIQRAIESGDSQTGITIMQMDKGLDTGNMLLERACEITSTATGSILHDRLAVIGSQAINDFLKDFDINNGSPLAPGEVQDNQQATYAHKLNKAEAEIDWTQSAVAIERKIRAFNAWPVSFTHVGNNRLRIWQGLIGQPSDDNANHSAGHILSFDKTGIAVVCGDGETIRITQLQADGSRAMTAAEMLNSKKQWFVDNPILGKLISSDTSVGLGENLK